ncbi:uncharacterized protein LOC128558078 [Mercenaria mercenaria]|uniref:uncharacterized protein LOC128558078 n=1 Tax=Mercenaria mercenaria TaxID=6596 RepID=UPI00234F9730|nr:uncharacterized protein LOC128558078 [Mercenaria mercenaria]
MESSEKKRKRGATKHCAYGKCNSDSRYLDRPEMKDVFFIRFPKPGKDFEKCVRWVKACSRKGFDETWVKKDTYICSIHFVGGKGPTDLHPDPIPANATKYDVQRFQKTPRRKVQRCFSLAESQNTNRKNVSLSKPLQYQRHAEQEVAEILLSLSENVVFSL